MTFFYVDIDVSTSCHVCLFGMDRSAASRQILTFNWRQFCSGWDDYAYGMHTVGPSSKNYSY